MESIYSELALYGSKNECVKTYNVFSLISEVCDGTVSLTSNWKKGKRENIKSPCRTVSIFSQSFIIFLMLFSYLRIKLD